MRLILARLTLICVSVVFVSLVLTGVSKAEINLDNIIALWLLDEGTGEIAEDSSGNGYDGAIMGGPEWVQGMSGKALRFDGEDDVVDFGQSSDLQPDTGTIHIRFKFDGVKGGQNHNQLLDKGMHSNDNGVSLYYNVLAPPVNNFVARWRGGGADIKLEYEKDMTNDTDWHHADLVWDTTNGKKLYFDGELVGESPDTNIVPICEACPFLIAQAENREYDLKGFIEFL